MLYVSFLVRLWRENSLEPGAPAPDWQAELQHIQSGQRWTFHSLDDLFAFVLQQAEPLAESGSLTGGALTPLRTR